MIVPNNKLLLFNSRMLLNKREVIESFNDFLEHHHEKENEERYSENKRKILLSLLYDFKKVLEKNEIPTLIKPWLYYEYVITNDSVKLALYKCSDIEFDDDGEISMMTTSEEHILVEVKCNYVSVDEYSQLYNVTATTVRQWIRRGKLRTAKKEGRDWQIPMINDKPKRGYESVTYNWDSLSVNITEAFPFLKGAECVYIFQDDDNKKTFHAITGWPGSNNRTKVELTVKEREKLELLLISAPNVIVEELSVGIHYTPNKRNFTFPILSYGNKDNASNKINYEYIIARQHSRDAVIFSPQQEPNYYPDYDYTSTYLIPVSWEFWGVPYDCDDIMWEKIDSNNYSACIKIGSVSGYFILCEQMIVDGYDPYDVCDDESADLEYLMSSLKSESGPLNEWIGDPMLNVLYIEDIFIEEQQCLQSLGSRILNELPAICRELVHVVPDILVYFATAKESKKVITFYAKNGFQELLNSGLLYAYTNLQCN